MTPWAARYEKLGSLVRSRDDSQKLRIMLEGRVRLRVTVKCGECGHTERHDMLRGEIPKFEGKLSVKEACSECKKLALKVEGVEEPPSYHPALEKALNDTYRIEKTLDDAIEAPVYESQLWKVGLKDVLGIGPIMAANLLTTFDPYKAEHVSGYWKYAGLHVIERCRKCGDRYFKTAEDREKWIRIVVEKLRLAFERRKGAEKGKLNEEEARKEAEKCICHCVDPEVVRVAPRRRRGEFAEWNPKARTLAWKVYTQLIMAGGKYAELYRKQKDIELARNAVRNPKFRPARVDLRAKRWMVKMFLEDLWLCSRTIEKLPITKSYSADKLGHHEEEKQFPYFLRDKGIV